MFHSLCGGTGSGLGSALIRAIREFFAVQFLFSVTVLPFESGESPLQHFNTLFCVQHLQMYTDAVLLFQNDAVVSVLTSRRKQNLGNDSAASGVGTAVSNSAAASASSSKLSSSSSSSSSVSMAEVNRHIALCAATVFSPLQPSSPSLAGCGAVDLGSLCTDFALSPQHKFFDAYASVRGHDTMPDFEYASTCLKRIPRHDRLGNPVCDVIFYFFFFFFTFRLCIC